MGWNGTHPKISKAEARRILGGSATKDDVYWAQCHPSEAMDIASAGHVPWALREWHIARGRYVVPLRPFEAAQQAAAAEARRRAGAGASTPG